MRSKCLLLFIRKQLTSQLFSKELKIGILKKMINLLLVLFKLSTRSVTQKKILQLHVSEEEEEEEEVSAI
jgi:hypothetical protein